MTVLSTGALQVWKHMMTLVTDTNNTEQSMGFKERRDFHKRQF